MEVCDSWFSYENFLKDMGPRPENYTLDRIDNDGPYSPDNCKWSSMSEQCVNRRNFKNTSGIIGVSKKGNRWVARIQIQGVRKQLGYFKTKEEAAKARQEAEVEYKGKNNG